MSQACESLNYDVSHLDIEVALKTIEIPACPAIVVQVMAEAQKDEPDLRSLAKSISADAGMAAVVLKLANSSLFRIGTPVTNVLKALERIGTRNTVSIIVGVALRSTISGVSPVFIERFWSRTSTLALAAGLIARKQYGVSPDAAYTYALFHDAGIPLMMKRFPHYEKMLEECHTSGQFIIDAEAQNFPCTHPVIASLLVRNWGLPPLVGQAIRFHHDPDVYDLPDKTLPGGALSLIAVTHLAEHMANKLDEEDDLEVGDELYERALSHFGIGENEREDLCEAILLARAEL